MKSFQIIRLRISAIITFLVVLGLWGWMSWINQKSATTEAAVMGTAFTFQGQVTEAGKPASGTYDLRFELYNDPNQGVQLGETELKEDRNLTDGYFTEVLDFDSSAFSGGARWLEIAARDGASSDQSDFKVLRPRQQIRPTPYALYVASCSNADTVDGLQGDSLARRTAFNIPDGGGSTTFAIPHYTPFTVTIAEASGSPDNDAVGFMHCIENDGVIAWLGFNGEGTMIKGKTSLNSTTTILSLRSGNIALSVPGDGTLTLKASSVHEDVRGVVIW